MPLPPTEVLMVQDPHPWGLPEGLETSLQLNADVAGWLWGGVQIECTESFSAHVYLHDRLT